MGLGLATELSYTKKCTKKENRRTELKTTRVNDH